ncbi:MAG: amino acid adenylation domain-containing protein, partial [Burkholderiales bacterium]
MNVAEAVEICGPIHPRIFQQALRQLVCEAETLRVRVIEYEGKPRQIVRPVYEGEFPYIDVSGKANPRAAAEAWMMEEVIRAVDLARDSLWVAALFKIAAERYFWYQRGHHVVYDGYSAGMIARRLAELYTAFVAGRDPATCEFGPLQALVEAEATYRDSDRLHRDRAFWKEQLAHLPEAVTLARGERRPSMGGLRRSIGYLSRETTRRLHELGKQTAASLPQVLIGLIAVYYHLATGANDLVVGMPVSGRVNRALRRSPGMVANVVAIRLSFTPRMTAAELFTQVARVVRQALRHQQYRYEDLRRDLGLVNQTQQIAWLGVNIEPFDYQLSFAGAGAIGHNLSNGSAEDLTVFVYDRGNDSDLRFDFDANPALYSMAELDEHRRRLMRVIDSVLTSPEQPLRRIDILGEEERKRLLFDWNDTTAPVPTLSLPAMIGRQTRLTPKAVAVVFQGTVLSYEELNERSVHEARRLIAHGVKPGDIVAVALPRSEQLVVTLLAITRSGAAYLPLDPDEPPERIAMVLDDASPVALITLPEMNERFSYTGLLLAPESLDTSLAATPHEPDLAAPEATVYVLYTSGSTGRPKGVEITHRNLGNFLQGMQRQLALTVKDRFLAVTTVAFDVAGLELFLPLTVGARVVIATGEVVRDPPALARLIGSSGATHMQATPSLWRVLLASAETRLDCVHALVGGEALTAELASRLLHLAARLTQFYGPTETTVWSTAIELNQIGTEPPPIGRPIMNTQLYVLDEYGQPVPTGAVGELYIGGAGVARGYLNRPQLTEERFLPDPFTNNGNRLYRTGDRVRWNADAVLEFVARADNQLKIRGHRVEPGEIETLLVQHPAIAEAVVCG